MLKKIKEFIRVHLPDLPRLLWAALRLPTGRVVIASALVWVCSRIGISWPFEQVEKFLELVGAGTGDPNALADWISAGILAYGTIFTNDTRRQLRQKAFPARVQVKDTAPLSLQRTVAQGKVVPVDYYELEGGKLVAKTSLGKHPVPDAIMGEDHARLIEHIRSRINGEK